jgi:hypothetical protein
VAFRYETLLDELSNIFKVAAENSWGYENAGFNMDEWNEEHPT